MFLPFIGVLEDIPTLNLHTVEPCAGRFMQADVPRRAEWYFLKLVNKLQPPYPALKDWL